MGNNQSTPILNDTAKQRDIRVKTTAHSNPEKDKGGICPICKDPKCGYF